MPELDFNQYEGREQAYVKHCLLEKYLPEWGYKIGSKWDSLVYVDAFAGPWDVRSSDLADSSFGVAVKALDRVAKTLNERPGQTLNVKCILVEKEQQPLAQLRDFAQKSSRPGFHVEVLAGEFIGHVPAICSSAAATSANPFRFIFVDPKGWSDIPMQQLLPLIRGRSCEVVVNLMSSFMRRFVELDDRAESFLECFGRDDVLPVIQETPHHERQDALVREYCKSLHVLAGFKYVSSAVIFEPKKDAVRYFLVYGTNHHRGIEVFKAAESRAARIQDEIRHAVAKQKSGGQEDMMGTLFGDAQPKSKFAFLQREQYCKKAKRKVLERLVENSAKGVMFAELFCDAMAFPLVTPADLLEWLESFKPHITVLFDGDGRKKPDPDKADKIVVVNPGAINAMFGM